MKRSPLRSNPETTRAWQDRSRKPLARVPMKKRNPVRLAKRRAEEFGADAALIRALPCCVCSAPGPNHPHHVRSRGAGGKSDSIVALCAEHHEEIHRIGRKSFAEKYEVDLVEEAARLAE